MDEPEVISLAAWKKERGAAETPTDARANSRLNVSEWIALVLLGSLTLIGLAFVIATDFQKLAHHGVG